jgi:ATP-dependent DNA helicase Rep
VMLVGVNEGVLPFKSGSEDKDAETTPERLEEERRLMYVGITRARSSLVVSTLRRRKKGRDTVVGVPSRFIAEMRLDEAVVKDDPRERLKKLRAEFASRPLKTADSPKTF